MWGEERGREWCLECLECFSAVPCTGPYCVVPRWLWWWWRTQEPEMRRDPVSQSVSQSVRGSEDIQEQTLTPTAIYQWWQYLIIVINCNYINYIAISSGITGQVSVLCSQSVSLTIMGIEIVVKMTATTALLVALLSLTEAARQKVRGRQPQPGRLDITE